MDRGQCSNAGHYNECRRLCKAHATRAGQLPARVLTDAETLTSRVPRRPLAGYGTKQAMTVLTVSIWHNVTRDPEGRHAGLGGFTPGDQMCGTADHAPAAR
jgi:hypothetical protein